MYVKKAEQLKWLPRTRSVKMSAGAASVTPEAPPLLWTLLWGSERGVVGDWPRSSPAIVVCVDSAVRLVCFIGSVP